MAACSGTLIRKNHTRRSTASRLREARSTAPAQSSSTAWCFSIRGIRVLAVHLEMSCWHSGSNEKDAEHEREAPVHLPCGGAVRCGGAYAADRGAARQPARDCFERHQGGAR